MQIYWLIAITGFFDFDIFDVDLDLEAGSDVGILGALAVFINIGKVPIALVFSLMVLNFWIVSMVLYFLPISPGGLINGLLLIPAFIVGLYITKYETLPLKFIFKGKKEDYDIDHKVLKRRCILKTDVSTGVLGQAEIEQNGASIVINVMNYFEAESFEKGERAFVFMKDDEEDVYYIAKSLSEKFEL